MATAHACREIEESFLHAYVDGEFSPEDCAEVKTHLARCSVCTSAVALQQSYKAAMRRAAIQAPHALMDQVRDELHHEPIDGRWLRAIREPKAIGFAAVAAGAAVWFLASGAHHPLLSRRSAFIDDGVAIHAKALPLDFAASDVASAQHWLDSKLDFGARLPRFAEGTRLEGVRLSSLNSRPAALVTYKVPQGDGRRVSLFIVDDPDSSLQGRMQHIANREVWLSQARGFNVASWRHDEVTYSLISDLDEQDVLALVKAAQQH